MWSYHYDSSFESISFYYYIGNNISNLSGNTFFIFYELNNLLSPYSLSTLCFLSSKNLFKRSSSSHSILICLGVIDDVFFRVPISSQRNLSIPWFFLSWVYPSFQVLYSLSLIFLTFLLLSFYLQVLLFHTQNDTIK